MSNQKPDELIICAAILLPDGYIVRGHRHHHALRAAAEMRTQPHDDGVVITDDLPRRYSPPQVSRADQGFITSRNRFVGRKEAYQIHFGKDALDSGLLYSEDLY